MTFVCHIFSLVPTICLLLVPNSRIGQMSGHRNTISFQAVYRVVLLLS